MLMVGTTSPHRLSLWRSARRRPGSDEAFNVPAGRRRPVMAPGTPVFKALRARTRLVRFRSASVLLREFADAACRAGDSYGQPFVIGRARAIYRTQSWSSSTPWAKLYW